MKLKIKSKLLILVLGTTLLIYVFAFGFIIYNNYRYSKEMSTKYTDAVTADNAQKVMNGINEDFAKARTLSQGFVEYSEGMSNRKDLSAYKGVLKNVLEKNPGYYGVALSLELAALDEDYNKDYGRLRISYFNIGGVAKMKIDTLELEGDNVGSPYYNLKLNPQEDISEPYLFSPYNNDVDLHLISSISVPLMKENKFIGLMQFDIMLNYYERIIYEIKPFTSAEAFMISSKGSYFSGSGRSNQNKAFEDILYNVNFNILQKIKNGENFSYIQPDSVNQLQYHSHYPLKFGNSSDFWSLRVSVPYNEMLSSVRRNLYISIFALLLGMIVMAIIIWYVSKSIAVPLSKTAYTMGKLAVGDISSDYKIKISSRDEIGDINNLLNSLIDGLVDNINFASEIGRGNLEYNFTPISEKDALGSALLGMRKSLKQAEVEEKRRKSDDQKLNWSTQGFAKFGELMRENTDNLAEFSYNIISNIVKYLNANQGGLFLINDSEEDNIFIELLAGYAYNRRKYIDKKINLGVGLVGRCVNEQETIYMTDFPKDYLNITSGLGQSAPVSLLLVPIVFNAQVFGVIEMASLHKMERFQIEFVERIGESMGSTISNVKINEQTAKLLEESKVQSEKLISRDEELQAKIAQLQTVKETLNSKILDHEAVLKALDSVSLVAEFDMQGRLIDINKNFLNLIQKSKHEVVGMFQGSFAVTKDDTRNIFRDFWNELREGITKKSFQKIRINDKEHKLYESYMPIMDEEGNPYKVINFSFDVTNIYESQDEIDYYS